jgi:putative hydrolase of the HAD superfamily
VISGPVGRDLDAVLFDALGTVVRLEDPTPLLQRSLQERLGVVVPADRCAAAMRAEMRHYRAGCHRASDAARHAALRLECAEVLADGLGEDLTGPDVLPCLTDAIVFRLYPDVAETLDRLADAGLRLGMVSNWDVSLHVTLDRLGLGDRFETVVTSAEAGASKPEPGPFTAALGALDVLPHRALHVGDDAVCDVDGPRAAGLHAILLQRRAGAPERTPRMATLHELPAILDLDRGR